MKVKSHDSILSRRVGFNKCLKFRNRDTDDVHSRMHRHKLKKIQHQ